jgi:hypothetical protein
MSSCTNPHLTSEPGNDPINWRNETCFDPARATPTNSARTSSMKHPTEPNPTQPMSDMARPGINPRNFENESIFGDEEEETTESVPKRTRTTDLSTAFQTSASLSTTGGSFQGSTGGFGWSSTPSPCPNSSSYSDMEGSTFSFRDYLDPRPKEDDPVDDFSFSFSKDRTTSPTPFADHHQRVQFQDPNLARPNDSYG